MRNFDRRFRASGELGAAISAHNFRLMRKALKEHAGD
jgi:hypothetical protein